jgi:multisubunit Na+/H+ antiporter MnhB subunit
MTLMTDPSAPTPAATSTTRRTLWQLLAALLGLTAVVLAASVSVMAGTSRTAETVRGRSAPSILELAAVRTAMIRADAAAIDSFRTGRARLAGPGDDYQRYLAAATQGLAEAARDIVAGEKSSLRIQLVEGQIVSYTGLVGQAHAHYRQNSGDSLATVYLWYASLLLHDGGGILDQIDGLTGDESSALAGRLSSGWLSPAATLLWVVPMLALLGALLYAQRFLRQRFRRRLNAWLLVSTVLLVTLAGGTSLALVSKSRLAQTRTALTGAEQLAKEQASGVDAQGQRNLAQMLRDLCPRPGEEAQCGWTVQEFLSAHLASSGADPSAAAPGADEDNRVAEGGRAVNREAESASGAASYALVGLVVAVLLGTAVWLGLRPRIEEYRFRSR